ncbi:MAG: SdpI family protein [Anaerolineae bacterium]
MNDQKYTKMWIASGISIAIMFGVSLWAWFQIPAGAVVPIHFDISGKPDGFGNPFPAVFLLPIVLTGVVGLIGLIPRIEPRKENFQMSSRAYRVTWGALLVFFSILHVVIILSILEIGQASLLGNLIPLGLGGLFVVLGNVMGKVRSNFMFGIRTPWTLSSELSWNKTHRLGGRIMMSVGLLTILTGLLISMEWAVYLLSGGMVLMLVVVMVYSWVVYRSDPEIMQA